MRSLPTSTALISRCCSGLAQHGRRRLAHCAEWTWSITGLWLQRAAQRWRRLSETEDFEPQDLSPAGDTALEWRLRSEMDYVEGDRRQVLIDRVFDSWEAFFASFSDDPRDLLDRDQYLSLAGPVIVEAEREDRSQSEDEQLAANMCELLLAFQAHRLAIMQEALQGARQDLEETTRHFTRANLERAHLVDELTYCQHLMQDAERAVHARPVIGAGDGRRLATRMHALVGALRGRRSRVIRTPLPMDRPPSSANLRFPEADGVTPPRISGSPLDASPPYGVTLAPAG